MNLDLETGKICVRNDGRTIIYEIKKFLSKIDKLNENISLFSAISFLFVLLFM